MKISITASILLLALAGVTPGQTLQQARNTRSQSQQAVANPTIILEVMATDFDIAWQQKYLYLRVFSDRTAECEIVKRKGFDKADRTTVKRIQPERDVKGLEALLRQPEILQLQTVYKQRIAVMLDAGTSWEIRIPHLNQTQTLEVVAFSPDEARARKRPYPRALVKLGCTIDALRADATGERLDMEEECKKAPVAP